MTTEVLPSLGKNAHAQTAGSAAARRRSVPQPLNGPNVTTANDLAAGAMIDSLFAPLAPVDPLPQAKAHALGVQPSKAAQRTQWAARLARNPHPEDGNPSYVLIDRYGGIQRYVEPVPQIDLEQHVGQTVSVRRDTGHTLLASQLDLPRRAVGAARVTSSDAGVRLAAGEEPLPPIEPTPADGEPVQQGAISDQGEFIESDGPMFDESGQLMMIGPDGVDPLYLDGASHAGDCTTCGSAVCGAKGGCGFGSRPMAYVRGEYLLWWFDGMETPPLVVQSENVNFNPADIIYGNDEILDGSRDGARVAVGYWLDDYGKLAIEADYFGFSSFNSDFVDGDPNNSSDPPPYIGRPFFNILPFIDHDGIPATPLLPGPAVEDVETDDLSGTVRVEAESRFQSAGIRLRRNLCCIADCATDCGDGITCGSGVGCDGCGGGAMTPACAGLFKGGTRHVDMIYGVRWTQLEEFLHITEDLEIVGPTADPNIGATFDIQDNFDTSNEFIGGEIGFLVDWERRRWSLELLSKLAIGNTRQRVFIDGVTVATSPPGDSDPPQVFPDSGLLVQPSNAGVYERNEFSVIPEIGVTAGYMLTERARFTLGYTLLYWSRVVRPGDQISLDVNADFLGNDQPELVQPARPEFVFRDTDIWAHGLNAGIDYRW